MLLMTFVVLTHSIPTHRHSKKQRDTDSHSITQHKIGNSKIADNLREDNLLPGSAVLSPYVRFSSTKPVHPPWASDEQASNSNSTSNDRERRSTQHIGISVCDTLREWSQPETAKDFNGKTVQVMTMIDQGGSRQLQYFYETFCSMDGNNTEPSCLGIDTSVYTSKCITKHIWVNAYVKNERNQVGWAKIKIRGSCNCSLYRASVASTSIWDDLLRKR